ncbi:hypothetical protein NBE98_05330 [Clostridium swellfunianum]|uniref:hypothetical protein n=1 Tax=Clostridium swellfunianum TaxID=1367462 RepID=UPI0020301046|nr:hypothetical protein [Clostridium swellfunianum]MCM0647798.1 hypothetical protein [Clostridium swellfunianum]
MEILLLFFGALILIAALSSGQRQTRRTVRKSLPSNFRTYFHSLPQDSQVDYMNTLNDIQRMQFMEMLDNDNIQVTEEIVNEFNDWTDTEENSTIEPYDNCDFQQDYNCEGLSSEEEKWKDNYYDDSSSWDLNDFSNSDDSYSDLSNFSDSGSYDNNSDTNSSDF